MKNNTKAMYIKSLQVFLIIPIIFLMACSGNEDSSDKNSNVGQSVNSQCLDGFIDNQVLYLQNNLDLSVANDGVQCAISLLKTANKIFRGTQTQISLSANQAASLLNGTMLIDKPIPGELIVKALVIKSWFLGGGEQEFSSIDIETIISILQGWSQLLIDVQPYLETLSWKQGQGNKEAYLLAQDKFIEAIMIFLQQFQKEINPFDIEILKDFMKNISQYTNSQDYTTYVKLFHGIVFLINGRDDVVDLPKTIKAFMVFYFEYKNFVYEFDLSYSDLVSRPKEYYQWTLHIVDVLAESIDDNITWSKQGFDLVYDFLTTN